MTLQTFTPLIGSTFKVIFSDGEVPLTLAAATPLGHGRPNTRDPFSLVFKGPNKPQLPQYTYTVRHETLGEQSLFLVPIAAGQYEAVFT